MFGGIFVIISHGIGQCSLQLENNFTISCNKMCGDCIIYSRVEGKTSGQLEMVHFKVRLQVIFLSQFCGL